MIMSLGVSLHFLGTHWVSSKVKIFMSIMFKTILIWVSVACS